jgi:hypothetical protein
MTSRTTWLLAAAAGAAALGAGLYAGHRRSKTLGRARLLGRAAPAGKRPGQVSETSAGGAKLRHLRSEDMPIQDRVRVLQDLVWKSVQDPRMRKIALDTTRHCPERDGECEARAVYKAVKKRVRYTGDVGAVKMGADGPVESVDFFQSAYRTWDLGGGDCDDNAVLNATLLLLNGIDAKLRVTAEGKGSDWSHIYCTAQLPKNSGGGVSGVKDVALDTTLPGSGNFGREVPYGRKLDFVA